MAFINAKEKIVGCKIVYYGPGQGGKTTNLEYIHRVGGKHVRGDIVSINTKGDRTLFFDFLLMHAGRVNDYDIKVQLYTVPGQAKYNSTRKMVLKNADGLVFVADSLEEQRKENILSLKNLQENLIEQHMNIFEVPLVIQFNKRDLVNKGVPIMPVELMEAELNAELKCPTLEASALNGTGVSDTLKKCMTLTLSTIQQELL